MHTADRKRFEKPNFFNSSTEKLYNDQSVALFLRFGAQDFDQRLQPRKIFIQLNDRLGQVVAEELSRASQGADGLVGGIQDWLDLVLQQVDQASQLDNQDDQGQTDYQGFQRHENDKNVPDGGGGGGVLKQENDEGDQRSHDDQQADADADYGHFLFLGILGRWPFGGCWYDIG
jgi:hypothetical protein